MDEDSRVYDRKSMTNEGGIAEESAQMSFTTSNSTTPHS